MSARWNSTDKFTDKSNLSILLDERLAAALGGISGSCSTARPLLVEHSWGLVVYPNQFHMVSTWWLLGHLATAQQALMEIGDVQDLFFLLENAVYFFLTFISFVLFNSRFIATSEADFWTDFGED